jgi:hypothetical protein
MSQEQRRRAVAKEQSRDHDDRTWRWCIQLAASNSDGKLVIRDGKRDGGELLTERGGNHGAKGRPKSPRTIRRRTVHETLLCSRYYRGIPLRCKSR